MHDFGLVISYAFVVISIFFVIGIILLLSYLEKSKKTISTQTKKEKVPLFSPKIYAFLIKHGIVNSGALSKSFVNALAFLHDHVANKDYKYSIPWYLLVGPENSGKSSILNSLADLHLPDQKSDNSNYTGCEWYMFMNGIVMEVKDTVFTTNDTKSIVNKNWRLLSMLLAYFRPRKPLDGIILTLPVDLLQDDDKFAAQKKIIAQNMFDNLYWMQNNLNIRLPIYVIITKSDLIHGFSDICMGLNSTEKDQIFGWSSSYSLDTAYSPSWVDEAFSSLRMGVKKTILKIAANNSVSESIEDSLYIVEEIEKIKDSIKVFTNTIFSPNTVGVELVMRGLYFTGLDFGERSFKAAALNPEFFVSNTDRSTLVNFVQDLFCEKIFLEKNIAQPIQSNFIFHGRRLIAKRIIMAVTSLFLVLGFYFSQKHVVKKASEFALTLSEIDNVLYSFKNNNISGDLKQRTKFLLDYLLRLEPEGFYSLFIPISWVSSIRRDIQNAASNAFDKTIVKSMYSELEKKANNIKESFKVVLSNRIVLSPTDTQEFVMLKKYVKQVLELEKVGDSYNTVLISDESNSIDNLAKFLYADDIKNQNVIKQRIKKDTASYKKFDLSQYKKEILRNILTLHQAFIESCFAEITGKIFINISANIENFVKIIEDQRRVVTTFEVIDLYKKIEIIINFLQSNMLNWWDKPEFNPSEEYTNLLTIMGTSRIIDEDFIKTFKEYSNNAFTNFKLKLSNVQSSVTGNLISRGHNIIVSEPSQKFLQFYKDLKKILQQKFIINMEDQNIITEIPDEKILFWNNDLVKQCSKLIDEYYNFIKGELASFDMTLQPLYRDLAKKTLNNTIKVLIARAQVFEDNSQNITNALHEGAIKRSCEDLRDIYQDIINIARFFTEEFSNDFSQNGNFITMIFTNYSKIMNDIDLMFKSYEPFSLKKAMFDSWDGKVAPNLTAFAASDQEELGEYVDTQISRLIFLKELAEPVVALLQSKYFNYEANNILLNKWNKMIAAIEEYKRKSPGNSLSLLESFIKKTLGDFNLGNITSENKLDIFLDIKKDFFLNKRALIARYLKFRSQEILYAQSFVTYNQIAKMFNENISGYFPFIDNYNNVYPDCSPEHLERFLEQFKTIDENVIKALETLSEVNLNAKDAVLFIKKMQKAIPFIEGWLLNYYKKAAIESPIAFKIEFRSERTLEVGGDQIIGWKCKVGDEFISIDDKDKMMTWDVGQEISAIFQWAADSNEVPHADTKGLVDILGPNAVFRYVGNWALIRLIKSHQVMSEVYPGAGVTMMFTVPTVTKQDFKKFRDIKLYLKIKFFEKFKDNWKAVSVPDFPNSAPIIDIRMAPNVSR